MSTYLLGRVALATMPALIMLTSMTASTVAAVTNIDACQVLDKFGETYRVTQDLSSCGNCLVVADDRITIDLQGHQISGNCFPPGAGITDAGIARDSITVKNGTVSFYIVGIDLGASRRTTVRNVTALENGTGIAVGSQSLVKDCHARFNVTTGITGFDRVQVQGCVVSGSSTGISVSGEQCLITSNDASNNGFLGIAAGERCTVSHNVANENGNSGIAVGGSGAVGTGSLVTGNEANNNVAFGIIVVCPSTVTNNTATGNGSLNYEFFGTGCHTNNNKE